MATLQLGRCVLPDVNIDELSLEGDDVSISGAFVASSTADRDALVAQLAGYGPHNTDEPVVPLIVGASSMADGFVRVVDAGGPLTHDDNAAGNRVPFSIRAERVPGWQAPLFEVLSRGAGTTPIVGIPDAADDQWAAISSGSALPDDWQRPGADGNARILAGTGADLDLFDNADVVYMVGASDYYDAACKIEVGGRVVVGRQPVSDVDGWSINNGLVKVTYRASGGRWNVQHYDGTQWDTAKDWRLWHDGSAGGTTAWGAEHSLTVMRNSPETCVIRLHCAAYTPTAQTYYDLTVKRGDRFARVYAYGFGGKHGVLLETAEAGTAPSAHICTATSTDASGNRYYARGDSGVITADTTNGGVFLTAAAAGFSCGIASQVNYATITSFDNTTGLDQQYDPTDVVQQIAAR